MRRADDVMRPAHHALTWRQAVLNLPPMSARLPHSLAPVIIAVALVALAKRDVRVFARKVGRRSYAVTTAIKKIKKREVRLQVSLTCVRAR